VTNLKAPPIQLLSLEYSRNDWLRDFRSEAAQESLFLGLEAFDFSHHDSEGKGEEKNEEIFGDTGDQRMRRGWGIHR